MTQADYKIIFDGGSIGNPGAGYGSYAVLRALDSQQRIARLEFPDQATNNEAEYDTLAAALEDLLNAIRRDGGNPAEFTVEVRGDSSLVIQQVSGRWKADCARMKLRRELIHELAKQFRRVWFIQHPRAESVKILGH
jgi:probable phosphoglycerate mutase